MFSRTKQIDSCFPALGKQFHVFPRLANTFLFSRAWSVTDNMGLICFWFNSFTLNEVLKGLFYRLSFSLHWNSVNITSHLIWVHRGPKCVPQQCLANITIKKKLKNCTHMPQKINIKYDKYYISPLS